jgi:hypothetical protein
MLVYRRFFPGDKRLSLQGVRLVHSMNKHATSTNSSFRRAAASATVHFMNGDIGRLITAPFSS